MKRLAIIFLIILITLPAAAQWPEYSLEDHSSLDAGVGMTWIGGKSYYGLTLHPDLSIGKFGIGLNVDLLLNTKSGKIRKIDWNSGYDYARIIRYIRWGRKGDNFYTRVGTLDRARIGHGSLLNYYHNHIDYDNRKIGLVLDADFGRFGFETMASNLGRMELLGGRFYLRPIYNSKIPILKNFAVGASYVTDIDPDQHVATTQDGMQAYSVDVELPLIKTSFWNVLLYADHAQLVDYGNGQSIGIGTEIDLLGGFLTLGANYERRFMSKEYTPNYFGPFYEVMRYTTTTDLITHFTALGGDTNSIPDAIANAAGNPLRAKQELLPMLNTSRRGWFGGLSFDFLHLVKMIGTYQKIDGIDKSGMMHLEARLSHSIPIIAAEASYDKWGINSFNDVTTLDYRSVARVGLGYKIKPYLLLYLDYIWNFEWDEANKQYKPQERFQPRVVFRYDLGNLGF